MTTIAYRDGVMAGDSAYTDDCRIVGLGPKVIRFKHVLYGGAGDADDRVLVSILKKVKTPADLPSVKVLRKFEQDLDALIVFRDGRTFSLYAAAKAGAQHGLHEIFYPFASIGSGRDVALGAMAAGASAERAVEISCEHTTYSCPPVTSVQF